MDDSWAGEKSHVGMMVCFFCNEPSGVVLDRRLRKTLPRQAVYDHHPCQKCEGYMKQGIIFISVRDGESGSNPYRSGGWWVIKEEAVRKMFGHNEDLLGRILQYRFTFIPDEACKQLGLERANKEETTNAD